MAYKTFANGFPLPASDLNNFLMNQSVIVFADAAARTTAIPSPVEGMLTYLEDTNAYESWNGSAFVGLGSPITTEGDLITGDATGVASRIPIGTADQVLTVASGVPVWADAAGGGGIELLTTTTLSGSTVTISSIDTTYKKLLVEIIGVELSLDGDLQMNFKAGVNSLAAKGIATYNRDTTPTNNRTAIIEQPGGLEGSNTENFMTMTVNNYSATNNYHKSILGSFSAKDTSLRDCAGTVGYGFFDSSTGAIDGITIFSNQTMNAGTVKIYGVN
jgi:hypothetical protein